MLLRAGWYPSFKRGMLPAVLVVVMVSPVAMPMPIGASNHNWRGAIDHRRRGYHHRRWIHDDRRWRDDHRCRVHRYPNANGDPNPCLCRERQGKRCETEHSDNEKYAEQRYSALHASYPLVVADDARPYLLQLYQH